jgi:hypothetical protein
MIREAAKEFTNIEFDKVELIQGVANKTIAGKHRVMAE